MEIKEKLIKFVEEHLFESIADVKADLSNKFPGHRTKVTMTPSIAKLTVDNVMVTVEFKKISSVTMVESKQFLLDINQKYLNEAKTSLMNSIQIEPRVTSINPDTLDVTCNFNIGYNPITLSEVVGHSSKKDAIEFIGETVKQKFQEVIKDKP